MKVGLLLTSHNADRLTPMGDLHLLLSSVHLYTKLYSNPLLFLFFAKKLDNYLSGYQAALMFVPALLDRQFQYIMAVVKTTVATSWYKIKT